MIDGDSQEPLLAEAKRITTQKYGLDVTAVTRINSGRINATYQVIAKQGRFVLQRMNAMFSTRMVQDFQTVTDHLRSLDWVMPVLILTKAGELYVQQTDAWWRLMSYIPSDPKRPDNLTSEDYQTIGTLLAQLHLDFAKLNYELAYSLPHYHDTGYYRGRLTQVLADFTDVELRRQADAGLAALDNLPTLPPHRQLVHGDPQTSNILFRDGRPLTFIDFDTMMVADAWDDLGDMLRSLAEDAIEQGGNMPLNDMRAIIASYYQLSPLSPTEHEFYANCLYATQGLALQLGMRFLTDVVEDNYFGFDASRFASRRDSNEHRAKVQWKIYQQCQEAIDD